jgi:hypothetical protein
MPTTKHTLTFQRPSPDSKKITGVKCSCGWEQPIFSSVGVWSSVLTHMHDLLMEHGIEVEMEEP